LLCELAQANPASGHIPPLGELFDRAALPPPAPFPQGQGGPTATPSRARRRKDRKLIGPGAVRARPAGRSGTAQPGARRQQVESHSAIAGRPRDGALRGICGWGRRRGRITVELSCSAARAAGHPFSRISAGQPGRPIRPPAESASATCYASWLRRTRPPGTARHSASSSIGQRCRRWPPSNSGKVSEPSRHRGQVEGRIGS